MAQKHPGKERRMLTADRFALLVSLVPYLRARGGPVSVDEAATHFDVTQQEIRTAIELIAVSGRPGEVGTYQDLDLFDIDWDELETNDRIVVTRFIAFEDAPAMSSRETASLLAGLQYLRQLPGLASNESVDRLIRKLAPDASASPITVDAAPGGTALPAVQDALERDRRVTFHYRSPRSGSSQRTVDPIALEALDDAWYLRAWCLERDAERIFLIDRMRDAVALDAPTERHERTENQDSLFMPGENDPIITLEVERSAIPLIREYLPDRSAKVPVPDTDGFVRVDVRAGSWEHFARLACRNAGRVRVIAPPEARDAVIDWARRGLAAAG